MHLQIVEQQETGPKSATLFTFCNFGTKVLATELIAFKGFLLKTKLRTASNNILSHSTPSFFEEIGWTSIWPSLAAIQGEYRDFDFFRGHWSNYRTLLRVATNSVIDVTPLNKAKAKQIKFKLNSSCFQHLEEGPLKPHQFIERVFLSWKSVSKSVRILEKS